MSYSSVVLKNTTVVHVAHKSCSKHYNESENHSSAELSLADVIADLKTMWAKDRQLSGRSENRSRTNPELDIPASNISTDDIYLFKAPCLKFTANLISL